VDCLAFDPSTSAPPIRISLFIGVDAITYSTDGSKCALYAEYLDRELATKVSTSELAHVVSCLTGAGLLRERSRELGEIAIPPQTYEIRIKWPDREFQCRWWHSHQCRGGCQVPSKYLDMLDDVPASWKTDILRKFIDVNRKLNAEEKEKKWRN
jgi:hypothetical protein